MVSRCGTLDTNEGFTRVKASSIPCHRHCMSIQNKMLEISSWIMKLRFKN